MDRFFKGDSMSVKPKAGTDYKDAKANRWGFLEATYNADKGYLDGSYLLPHRRENVEQFNTRKSSAYQVNSMAAIIQENVSDIFATMPKRGINKFFSNSDGAGGSYNNFLRRLTTQSAKLDSAFVSINNEKLSMIHPKDIEKALNKGFKIFPLWLSGDESTTTPHGTAWELATIQHRLYNLTSLINSMADDQAYPILSTPGDSHNLSLPSGGPLTGQNESPSYITQNPPLTELLALKTELENEMLKVGGLGEAKNYSKINTARMQVQKLDRAIMGALGMDATIEYPKVINPEQGMEIFSALDSSTTPPPPELMAEMVKVLTRDFMKDTTLDANITEHYLKMAELPEPAPEF
jgi:hypothetical protein